MEITLTLCFLVSLRDRPIVIPFALSPSISLSLFLSLSLSLAHMPSPSLDSSSCSDSSANLKYMFIRVYMCTCRVSGFNLNASCVLVCEDHHKLLGDSPGVQGLR